jgi:hypothetical protein
VTFNPDILQCTGMVEAGRSGERAAVDGLVYRDYAEFLVLILGHFKAGYAERSTDAVRQISGQAPRSIERYAQDYRASWS